MKELNNKQKKEINKILINITGIDEDLLNPTAILNDDLTMDSLDQIEAIMDLEKHFCIKIPDEKAESVRTIQDIYDMINQIMN